jgi:hypothetical protein
MLVGQVVNRNVPTVRPDDDVFPGARRLECRWNAHRVRVVGLLRYLDSLGLAVRLLRKRDGDGYLVGAININQEDSGAAWRILPERAELRELLPRDSGVLEITMPAPKRPAGRRIEIQEGSEPKHTGKPEAKSA